MKRLANGDRVVFYSPRADWGIVFRRGLFEIGAEDFETIAAAMAPE